MKYGVFISEIWEAWMDEFDTLEEARACVTEWRTKSSKRNPTRIVLVHILSEHEEGDLS